MEVSAKLPNDDLTKNLPDESYIQLFKRCLAEEDPEVVSKEFYSGFEHKINKIYFVSRSQAKHIYSTSTGEIYKFKPQKFSKIEPGFEKRTVDPADNNPFHYWEFKHNDEYLIHYTCRLKDLTIDIGQYSIDENNTPYINNTINEFRLNYEAIDDTIYRQPEHDNSTVFETPPYGADNDFMDTTERTEPAEDYFIRQTWASYNPLNETLTLNCNLALATNYEFTHSHADYAEWLPRNDPSEIIQPGDVVGIISSKKGITKTIYPSYVAGVISSQHAICANLPGPDIRPLGEPVAFKGQVPIKVIGEVKPNDIIVPSGRNDGTGIAKRLCKTPELMNHVVGHAWEGSKDVGIKLVNCLIDIKSPDAGYKVESNVSARDFELQELIMHNLAELDHFNTFIDLHLVNQTAILAELKDLVRRLLNLSGLTIIVWVDKSAVHGFIKNQFLSEFGEPDILSGAVLLEEKESLIFVEEWSRDVSYPDYSPMDFDRGVKPVKGVAQALLGTLKQANVDNTGNHTLIISVDIPPNIILEAKRGLKSASFINMMTKYPITRGFVSNESVQLYQVNVDSLPRVDELHFAKEELWAQSAIPHQNVPKGITRGLLKPAGWEMKSFTLPKLKDHIVERHMDCKAIGLQNALLFPQDTSLIIIGGTSSKSKLNEHAYKIVQDSSGRVHSFAEMKTHCIRPDGIVFKLSSHSAAVLYRDGLNFDFNVVEPEESFSLKNKGQVKVEGVPLSVVHDQFYYIASHEDSKLYIYKASTDLATCKLLTSHQYSSVLERVQLIPHSSMKVQINEDMYSITNSGLVKHDKVKVGTIVDVSDSMLLTIRLINGKMTLVEINLNDLTDSIVGELLEVLPRSNFGCCKIKENLYALYGGIAVNSGETLNDIFTFSVQSPDYIARYLNTWAAKYKIFSEKKKRRLLSYQQAAERAYNDNDFITAEKFYEGLSKECPCFDYHFNFADALLKAKRDNEILHFKTKIETALQLASEYVQNLDQQLKIDRCQKTLDTRTGHRALSSAMSALSISNQSNSANSVDSLDLQNRFETAIESLNQVEALRCIKQGVPINDRYKAQLSKPSHETFIRHLVQQCCDSPGCEDWAVWLVQNFTKLLTNLSLLRLAIQSEQRKLVTQLLLSKLTGDINDMNQVTKEDKSIAELAAIKNFPDVLAIRYTNNRSSFEVSRVANALCTYASEEAFEMFLTFNVEFDYNDALKKCISNLSKKDAAKRMQMIDKILQLAKNTVKVDDILSWTLKKCDYEWLADIKELIDRHLSATIMSVKPLLQFLEETFDWDEDDIEPTIRLLVTAEHVKLSVNEILEATFKSFNECEDEVLIVKALQTLQQMFPNFDINNPRQPNLINYLIDEDIIDDMHIAPFFKCLVAVGFNQWKTADEPRLQIFNRFKRIANASAQQIVKASFSNMPSQFMCHILLLSIETEQILMSETIKMIEACTSYGNWTQLNEADRQQLLTLATKRKLSSVVDILRK